MIRQTHCAVHGKLQLNENTMKTIQVNIGVQTWREQRRIDVQWI